LNINLYDLLDWLRNPHTAARPDKFKSVDDLGDYSYLENKVFPKPWAERSEIANPLLRPIGRFHFKPLRQRNPHSRYWHGRTAAPGATTSEKTAKGRKGNDVSGGGKTKERDVQVVYPATTESTSSADAHADKEGTGASLFTAAESAAQLPNLKRRYRGPGRKHPGSISSERPSDKSVAPTAGQAIAVGA
jgi:hypothetical protein